MPRFIKARTDRLFRKASEQVIRDFSKKTRFVMVIDQSTVCPNCVIDGTTGAGTGVYNGAGPTPFQGLCPVCENKGKVTSEKQRKIDATVRWLKSKDADEVLPEGSLPQNFARVKTYERYKKIIEGAKFFLVDNIRYKRFTPPTNGGLLTYVSTQFIIQRDE